MSTPVSSHLTVGEIVGKLDQLAPQGAAETWDNVGLLVGDASTKIRGAIISIDLTAEAIQLAVQKNYGLIINHHPCIFPKSRGLTRLQSSSLIYQAIQKGISVACYHTNFDQCALEVVDQISKALEVTPKGRLFDSKDGQLIKLVTFVPQTHVEQVRAALCAAGAGHIGNYDSCTFLLQGVGTFRGSEMTQPFLGQPGQLEKADEFRIETIVPEALKDQVLKALKESHPYEEIAYDLYPVNQIPGKTGIVRGLGYGFWGDFPSPKPFSDFVKSVKSLFNIHGFWITTSPPTEITRIAYVAGKGASFVDSASSLGCDLMITGEVGYHQALSGRNRGMAVMEIGHRESEKFFIETMKTWLSQMGLAVDSTGTPMQKIWQEV